MELYAEVRRSVYVEGLSERAAARRFGVARDTVRKMLRYLCLPENSSAVYSLRISRRPASLTGHADRLFRPAHRVWCGPAEPGGAPDRERRASASTGGFAETGARATAIAAR